MQIKKAVITAAGRGVRMYPAADTVQKAMLPLVDRDGLSKPVIQIIAEEALHAGVEEVCVVCAPGDEAAYRTQLQALRDSLLQAYKNVDWAQEQAGRLDDLVRRLRFAVQEEPQGYGHAVACANTFVDGEPFLLMLSDHLYVSHDPARQCAQQLITMAVREDCAVAAVHATREHLIGHYGTLTGQRTGDRTYQIERILEKPSVSRAELELQTAGLRAGFYLCFFGMHVLTPTIFDLLDAASPGEHGILQLTPALQELSNRETYLALDVQGSRYDIGSKLGLLRAQVALSLAGTDRSEMLTTLVELMAEDGHTRGAAPDA